MYLKRLRMPEMYRYYCVSLSICHVLLFSVTRKGNSFSEQIIPRPCRVNHPAALPRENLNLTRTSRSRVSVSKRTVGALACPDSGGPRVPMLPNNTIIDLLLGVQSTQSQTITKKQNDTCYQYVYMTSLLYKTRVHAILSLYQQTPYCIKPLTYYLKMP